MNLVNFRFETDADGVALVTWDMPGPVDERHQCRGLSASSGRIVDKIASDEAIKGAVFTSGKDGGQRRART